MMKSTRGAGALFPLSVLAVGLWLVAVATFAQVPTTLPTAPTTRVAGERSIAELQTLAALKFRQGLYAEAEPVLEEMVTRLPRDTPEWRIARFYELACELIVRRERGQLEAPSETDFIAAGRAEMRAIATYFRTHARAARPRWLELYEVIALQFREDPIIENALEPVLAYWAQSTDLERARSEYLRLVWAFGQTLWTNMNTTITTVCHTKSRTAWFTYSSN